MAPLRADLNLARVSIVGTAPRASERAQWAARLRTHRLPQGHDAMLVFALGLMAALELWLVRRELQADTWLALLDGRRIALHGLPWRETKTIMLHGHRFIDQQWLAQLTMYGIQKLGGLPLLALTFAGLLMGSIAAAAAVARRLGGSAFATLLLLPLGWWLSFTVVPIVRPETMVLPLFVLLIFLLVSDELRPTVRVLSCLTVLVVWANLHGSVVLAAALAVSRGVALLWRQRPPERRATSRLSEAVALTFLPPLTVMATPYGWQTGRYYLSTVLNPSLARGMSEWQPLFRNPSFLLPVLAGALLTLWVLRYRPPLVRWSCICLLMLAGSALLAERNAIWFGLGALTLLPPLITTPGRAGRRDPAAGTARRGHLLDRACLVLALILSGVSGGAVIGSRDSQFQGSFSVPALERVQAQAAAQRRPPRVFADVYTADWLMWRDPQLVGNLAYDDRLELLSPGQFKRILRFEAGWQGAISAVTSEYDLLVLDTVNAAPAIGRILREDHVMRLLYRDRLMTVFGRRAAGQPG